MTTGAYIRIFCVGWCFALLFSSCSSLETGAGAENGEANGSDSSPEQPGPAGDTPVPASELNVDGLRDLYKNISSTGLSAQDRLRKDWLDGVLSSTEYLKQRICHLYNQPCLLEKYKKTEGAQESACGTTDFGALVDEVVALGDEETVSFWESQLGDSETTDTESSPKVIAKPSIMTSVFKLIGSRKVRTADGKYCFSIIRTDPYLEQLKLITDSWEFTVEGKKFQVFYQSSKEAHFIAATRVMDAFKDSTMVSVFHDLTGGDPQALDVDDPECNPDQAYRMFIVEGASMGNAAHATFELVGTGRTYINFRVEELGSCWLTGFRRAPIGCATQGQDQVNGNVAHEYFHANESAAFAAYNKALYSIDPCADCLASWASERIFPTSNVETAYYHWHLYYPHIPLGIRVPNEKPYGSSLFFLFLQDMGGDTPVKRYLENIPSAGFVEALEDASIATLIHDSFEEAFHEFAEASLNLNDLPGVHDFSRKHSDYQDFFLAVVPALLSLADYHSTIATRKTEVNISNLPTRSIRYFNLTSQTDTFHALNHSITIDATEWVKQGGHVSAIAIKVDEQDPLKYTVLKRVNLSKTKKDTLCFTKLNQEPEILMLVTSNATRNAISGKIEVTSDSFCNPVNFYAKWERPGKGTDYTGIEELEIRAVLGYNPGPMAAGDSVEAGPYARATPYFTQPPATADWPALYRTLSRLQASEVTFTPRVSKSVTSGGCTTTYDFVSSPPTLGPNDFLGMNIGTVATSVVDGKNQASYSLSSAFANPKFLTVSLNRSCSGTCEEGECVAGTEDYTLTMPDVRGTFLTGEEQFTQPDPNASSTWSVEFPQPLEVQTPLTDPKIWYLYYADDELFRLLIKPPICDVF